MHPQLASWIDLLFRIRVGRQVVCLLGAREHKDIRGARTHTRAFEIWRLSKALVVFPEGYRMLPPEEFAGLDGTVPDLKEEYPAREVGLALGEWLRYNRDSHIIVLHDDDVYWKNACGFANAESMPSITPRELGLIFKLDIGRREDQGVEWPRRLKDFLDNLDEGQSYRLVDFITKGEVGEQRR